MAWLNSFFNRSLENPSTSLSDPASWLFTALGARESASGVNVSPQNSLEITAVWAAVRMISSTVATLPLNVYRHVQEGKEKAREHPAYSLLHDRPNPEMSSFVLRELMLGHLLIYGDFFAEIERNGRGDPVALWPITPGRVRLDRVGGERVYVVSVDGDETSLLGDQMLHVPGFSLDGQRGLIPTRLAREALGLSKATEEFGASFFANGASPSGVLTHPGKLGRDTEEEEQARENLRKSWQGLKQAHRVMVLEEGMTFSPMSMTQEESQYLETRRFQVSEIARMFLIPPHMIGDLEKATFSNIEQQSLEYKKYCIGPWTRKIEQELNYKLFGSEHFAEFQMQGLLRGDSAARSEFYATLLDHGVLSVNEVRAMENLNAVPGGDERRVPMNTESLGGQDAAA